MGVLSITPESDVMTYIRDLYNIDVSVSRGNIYWPAVRKLGLDELEPYIEKCIGSRPLIGTEREVIDAELIRLTKELFKPKYDNGLHKVFSTAWISITNGWCVRSIDDQRKTHIQLILKHKRYGFIQKTKDTLTKFLGKT